MKAELRSEKKDLHGRVEVEKSERGDNQKGPIEGTSSGMGWEGWGEKGDAAGAEVGQTARWQEDGPVGYRREFGWMWSQAPGAGLLNPLGIPAMLMR